MGIVNTVVHVIERIFTPDKPPRITGDGYWELFEPDLKQWVKTSTRAAAKDGANGKDGVSVRIVDGRYREPDSAKPLPDLPDIATVPEGYAYVVDDDAIPGQLDLYIKGVGGKTWTIIQNWGGIPGQKGDKGEPGKSGATFAAGNLIGLEVKEDGSLYAYTGDTSEIDFRYDEESGSLFLVTT